MLIITTKMCIFFCDFQASGKICELCQRAFKHKWGLDAHIRAIHLIETPYKCSTCNKQFASYGVWSTHKKIHEVNRLRFLCTRCGESFCTKNVMKQHLQRVHQRVKKHDCVFCGKEFYKYYGLYIHMLTHTHEKYYNCELCQKSFGVMRTLNEHNKRFHQNQ